jgi:hypothetical protein
MTPYVAAASTNTDRLYMLYQRREQLSIAIAALEELAEMRFEKAPVIEIDKLRAVLQPCR